MYETCLEKGIHVFPRSWGDLKGQCSCPDWAVPCKHMAAVLYLIANEIDKNPFLVFELHDFDLCKGLEGIGFTTEGQKEIYIPNVKDLREKYIPRETSFEWQEQLLAELDFSILSDCREQLLTLLSEETVFYPPGKFKPLMQKAYQTVSNNLEKALRYRAIRCL